MNPKTPPAAESRGTRSQTTPRRDLLDVPQFCVAIGALLLIAGIALAAFALFQAWQYGASENSNFDLKSSILLWLPASLLVRRGWQLRQGR